MTKHRKNKLKLTAREKLLTALHGFYVGPFMSIEHKAIAESLLRQHLRFQQLTWKQWELAAGLVREYEFVSKVRKKELKSTECYVYVIADATGLVKIGLSKNPKKRLNQMQTGAGSKLRLIAKWKCDTRLIAIKFEKELHGILRAQKLWERGEWFKAEAKDFVVTHINSNIKRYLDTKIPKTGTKQYKKFIEELSNATKH